MAVKYERARELQEEYNRLAKQVNTRMTKLEKLARNPEYSVVLSYAYSNLRADMKALGISGNRFKHNIDKLPPEKVNKRELAKLNNVLRNFLDLPTSTKGGIDKIYNKRAKSLSKRYNADFTADDMKEFFDSGLWKKLSQAYGSDMTMKVIASVQRNAKEITAEIEKARRQHKKITISALKDAEGLNLDIRFTSRDKTIIANLAKMYAK